MTNRCPYCGTGDWCECALDHRSDRHRGRLRCICGTPLTDRYLCSGCEVRLHNNLTELVDLNGELHTALTRMVRMTERSQVGRSADKPLVFGQRAAETIRLVRYTLVEWVKRLAADSGTPLPANNAIHHLVEWLLHLLPEIATYRDDATVLYEEIQHLTRRARGAVDLQPRRFALGPCPETVETGERCHGTVRVFIPVEDDQPGRVECGTCRTQWTGEQWPRLYTRISEISVEPDPVIDYATAAVALGVGLSSLRRWVRLGLLIPARPRYVRLSEAWLCRENLRERRRARLAQYAV